MTARARRVSGRPPARSSRRIDGLLARGMERIRGGRRNGLGVTVADETWLLTQGQPNKAAGSDTSATLVMQGDTATEQPGIFPRWLVRDPAAPSDDAWTREEAIAALTEMGLDPTEERIARMTHPRRSRTTRAGLALGAAAASIVGYLLVNLPG